MCTSMCLCIWCTYITALLILYNTATAVLEQLHITHRHYNSIQAQCWESNKRCQNQREQLMKKLDCGTHLHTYSAYPPDVRDDVRGRAILVQHPSWEISAISSWEFWLASWMTQTVPSTCHCWMGHHMEHQRLVALATEQSEEETLEAIRSVEEERTREDENQECHLSFP